MTTCQHYTAITHHDGYHYALCLECGALEPLGPANMDVPEDEMALAQAIAGNALGDDEVHLIANWYAFQSRRQGRPWHHSTAVTGGA